MPRDIAVVIRAKDKTSGAIRGVEKRFSRLGKVATTAIGVAVGTIAVKGVGALMGKMKGAIDVAADFEAQMNILGIAARSSGTGLDDLRTAAIKVGADTELVGINASQAADAVTELYKAGLDTTQIFGDMEGYLAGNAKLSGVLRAAVDLQAASELDLATATEAVNVAMATFGMKSTDATAIADSFVRTADASTASVAELTEAMQNVGPIAAQFGWDLQDVNTALAILSSRGIKGSEAGTALRSMMTNLMRPTDKVEETLQDLGVSLYDVEGRLKTLPQIIGELSTAFTGTRTVITELGGATKAQAKEIKSYQSKIDSARRSLEEYQAGIRGTSMKEKTRTKRMAELTKKIGYYQAKINGVNVAEKKLIKTTKKLTEEQKNQAIQTLAGTYGMKAMNTLLAEGNEGWEEMEGLIAEAATAMEVAEARTKGFRAASEALSGVLESLYIRVGTPLIQKFLTPAAQKLAEVLGAAMDAGGGLKGFADVIRTEIMGIGAQAVEWLAPKIPETIAKFDDWIISVLGWLAEQPSRVGEAIAGWGPEITNWLDLHAPGGVELTAEQMGLLTAPGEAAMMERGGRPWWRSIADTIIIGWDNVITTVETKAREYQSRFSKALYGWLQVEPVWEDASALGPTYVSPILTRFADWLAGIAYWVGETGIPALVNIIDGMFKDTSEQMSLTPLESAILDGMRQIGEKVPRAFIDGIAKGMRGKHDEIIRAIFTPETWTTPRPLGGETRRMEAMAEFRPQDENVLWRGVKGLAGKITDVWQGLFEAKVTKEPLKDATQFGTDLGANVIGGATKELEADSPSKVFMRIGEDIAEGLADGISSPWSIWEVSAAFETLMERAQAWAMPTILSRAQQIGRQFTIGTAAGVVDPYSITVLANNILSSWNSATNIALAGYTPPTLPTAPTVPSEPYGPYGPLGPTFPGYQFGGVVPGPIGKPQLAVVHGGERYLGAGQRAGVYMDFRGAVFHGVSQEFVEDLFSEEELLKRLQGVRD